MSNVKICLHILTLNICLQCTYVDIYVECQHMFGSTQYIRTPVGLCALVDEAGAEIKGNLGKKELAFSNTNDK